ncbi:MAG: cation-translocating P-type ATPase, partial [Phascolarctobacterium sp.]|nr:cation-translocating P-type ATPase [Phascolarctobacterium sp.]
METIVVKIKGLRSAACVSSIEHKLQQLEYVEAVHVDFVTSEALVRSFRKIDIDDIQKVVEENGFSLEFSERASNFRRERPKKDNTLLFSGIVFFLLLLIETAIYFLKYELSVDLVMVAAGAEMFLVFVALLLARKHLAFGIKQLSSDIPSMDSLLAVSSLLAVAYSGYQAVGVLQGYASEYDLYCAAVAGAIFFTLYGKGNSQKAEQIFTSSKIESFKLPKATLLVNDSEHVISGNHLISGDTIIVREGNIIPADGLVLDGSAKVDQSEVSGSSALMIKGKGKEVFAETVVKSGSLKIKVTATGKNVKAVQLWRLANQYAQEPKSMQRLRHTDKIAAIFLPVITSIGVITALSWYFYSGDIH